MEGGQEKVPIVTPDTASLFFHLGRIVSPGLVLTGYFPVCLAKTFTVGLLCGTALVSSENLLTSLLHYIDGFESQALEECLSLPSDQPLPERVLNDVIIPMFSRFKCQTIPNRANVREHAIKIATFTMMCQPSYAMAEIRRGLLEAHPHLWSCRCDPAIVEVLYQKVVPSPTRVWDTVLEPQFENAQEERAFDFLRRFVLSLGKVDLAKFLRFVTGSPQCSLRSIKVSFNRLPPGLQRRPTANTCSACLALPSTYESFATFSREFSCLLENSHLWAFDSR